LPEISRGSTKETPGKESATSRTLKGCQNVGLYSKKVFQVGFLTAPPVKGKAENNAKSLIFQHPHHELSKGIFLPPIFLPLIFLPSSPSEL